MKAKIASGQGDARAPHSNHALRLAAGCLLMLLTAAGAAAQDHDDATRGLWDTAFMQQRPPGRAATGARRRPAYRPSGANKTARPETAASKAVVGITVWRLR